MAGESTSTSEISSLNNYPKYGDWTHETEKDAFTCERYKFAKHDFSVGPNGYSPK